MHGEEKKSNINTFLLKIVVAERPTLFAVKINDSMRFSGCLRTTPSPNEASVCSLQWKPSVQYGSGGINRVLYYSDARVRGTTRKQNHRCTQWKGLGVSSGAMCEIQSSYLACCLQRGQKGQWTTQLEELLDKLKNKQTNKIKKAYCN